MTAVEQPPTLHLTASLLSQLVGSASFRRSVGAARGGTALIVVELDHAVALRRVAQQLRTLPCVLVGWHAKGDPPPAPDLDLLLTATQQPPRPWVTVESVEETLAVVQAMVTRAPLASTTLVRLLRIQELLPVPEALVAESLAYATLQGGGEFQAWLAQRPAAEVVPDLEPPVLIERRDGMTEVILNRPSVRNAYSTSMREALVEILTDVCAQPDARLIIRGNGPAFSAGGDLREFGVTRDTALAHAIRMESSPALLLSQCADRVEARLHGACVGAGIELPAYAGQVYADHDTRFKLPEVAMGLLPGAGGTVSISRRCGRQRTAFLALTAQFADATTARAWGLVDQLGGAART